MCSKDMAVVTLKSGHVQPVWAGHPWVYAQAVQRVDGGAAPGDEVDVVDPQGRLLGRGLYSPTSAIPVRLYTRDRSAPFDAAYVSQRIARAAERRRRLGLPGAGTNAYRLVHAEGDELPGLVVDCFDDVLAVQFGTFGLHRRSAMILDVLGRLLSPKSIVDRTSESIARAENFTPGGGVVWGDTKVDELGFVELGLRYRIPLTLGQKTGFYLDQRPLRARVEQLAAGRRVLDTFAYVGAMSMAAARGGASEVRMVESNAQALRVAAACAEDNGLSDRIHFDCRDARAALQQAGGQGGYELTICDPPKLAPTRAARKKALQAMRRLAGLACRATCRGGHLVLCSCSSAIGMGELTRALALGARDAGQRPIVLERIFQGPDHPVPAAFTEGLYLITLLVEMA